MAADDGSRQEADRIEKEHQRTLLAARRLSLVVDLDQTVLHATVDPAMGAVAEGRDDIARVVLPEMPAQMYYIKLRPGLDRFLRRMAELFELHVYTMGSRSYAQAVVRLFDPDARLFYDRVLSRDDVDAGDGEPAVQRKYLRRIFPTDDTTVLIIDDRADVWEYARNLIPVSPCTLLAAAAHGRADTFFLATGDINRAADAAPAAAPFLLAPPPDAAADATGVEAHATAVVALDADGELDLVRSVGGGGGRGRARRS